MKLDPQELETLLVLVRERHAYVLQHTQAPQDVRDKLAHLENKLIAEMVHLEQEQRAAEYARLRVAALTEHELHCEESHPGYEYARTENARKSGDSPKPEGDGWEPNEIVLITNGLRGPDVPPRYRNWERFEFTETNYWRRRT